MRLTIIVSDKKVCNDELCYDNLVWEGTPADIHALQWYDNIGWIEFVDGIMPNQEITVLPDWANNALAAWVAENTKPAPDPIPPTAEDNKYTASQKLYMTDWTTIPDVSDPTKSNPHLGNADEFIAYRNQIRAIAINPVAGFIDWAVEPQAVWINT